MIFNKTVQYKDREYYVTVTQSTTLVRIFNDRNRDEALGEYMVSDGNLMDKVKEAIMLQECWLNMKNEIDNFETWDGVIE